MSNASVVLGDIPGLPKQAPSAPVAPTTVKAPSAPSAPTTVKAPVAPSAPAKVKAPSAPAAAKAPVAPTTVKAPSAPAAAKAPTAPSAPTVEAPKNTGVDPLKGAKKKRSVTKREVDKVSTAIEAQIVVLQQNIEQLRAVQGMLAQPEVAKGVLSSIVEVLG